MIGYIIVVIVGPLISVAIIGWMMKVRGRRY